MPVMHSDFPYPAENSHTKIVEERFYANLFERGINTASIGSVYVQQIPNIEAVSVSKPVSARMARFKKAGLLGCLNNIDVNSKNYKEFLQDSYIKNND